MPKVPAERDFRLSSYGPIVSRHWLGHWSPREQRRACDSGHTRRPADQSVRGGWARERQWFPMPCCQWCQWCQWLMPAAYAGGASGAESARVGWNLGLLAFYPVRVQNRGGSVQQHHSLKNSRQPCFSRRIVTDRLCAIAVASRESNVFDGV